VTADVLLRPGFVAQVAGFDALWQMAALASFGVMVLELAPDFRLLV
jgi:hypothetical protein